MKTLPPVRRVLKLFALALIPFALVAFGWFVSSREAQLRSEDLSVRTYQIRSAADQFFFENPVRIFIAYDDLIGPLKYLQEDAWHSQGEDYHELFPIRVDFAELAVAMPDGRKVIVFMQPGFRPCHLRQTQDGKIRQISREPEGIARYRKWLADQRKPDGIHTQRLDNGRRFEITYRGGVPHGPFRAYYANGKLWGEATYIERQPVGRHVVYDLNGSVAYETSFRPFARPPSKPVSLP